MQMYSLHINRHEKGQQCAVQTDSNNTFKFLNNL